MTGPDPDADLDRALGIDQLPPAIVTDDHQRRAAALLTDKTPGWADARDAIAQALADAEVRAVARYVAERVAAGTLSPPEPGGRA